MKSPTGMNYNLYPRLMIIMIQKTTCYHPEAWIPEASSAQKYAFQGANLPSLLTSCSDGSLPPRQPFQLDLGRTKWTLHKPYANCSQFGTNLPVAPFLQSAAQTATESLTSTPQTDAPGSGNYILSVQNRSRIVWQKRGESTIPTGTSATANPVPQIGGSLETADCVSPPGRSNCVCSWPGDLMTASCKIEMSDRGKT